MAGIATSKQTGGGGFNFEDKVSAYFSSKLLSGNFALNRSIGNLTEIAYQVRPDGWLLDDLLLSFDDGKVQHKVAVSAKSNRQITANGLPENIVRDIWTQFLNTDKVLFDEAQDFLLFVVSPISRSVAENLNKLIHSAQVTDPATLAKRIGTKAFSRQQRVLFNSFLLPKDIRAGDTSGEDQVCRLLSRLIFLEFDFQDTVSKDENGIISELQGVLKSNNQADANRLYNVLKAIRTDIGPHGGSLNYQQLVDRLVNDFELVSHPRYQEDWDKIQAITDLKIANIPDKIGNRFTIERSKEVKRLQNKLDEEQFVFFTGKSGYGKTVVAKYLAKKAVEDGRKVIWLDADLIQSRSYKEAVGLKTEVVELIEQTNNLGNIIVVDGADRFFKDSIMEAFVPFIRSLACLKVRTWKMVITCQTEDYETLIKHIYRKNVPPFTSTTVEIKSVSLEEMLPSVTYFPQLSPLFKHSHLETLLGNLKYLDLIAFHIGHSNLASNTGRIGESDLIDWIWQNEILENGEQGYLNSRFLHELATKQADNLTVFTPITEFKLEESAAISGLKKMKIIGDSSDRLFFVHDLFGDWARYKTIRSNGGNVKRFLLELDLASPLWGKAIRLYGIYLLEKNEDASSWLEFFKGFKSSEPKEKLVRTLLLEAIFFSSSTFEHLQELLPEFKKNNGELINQFFEQFLARGTSPDPSMIKLAGNVEGASVSEIASHYRVPIYNYWFSVLKFTSVYFEELKDIAKGNILKIVTTWLDFTAVGSAFRREMAEIAIQIATWCLEQKKNDVMFHETAASNIYRALLKSYAELPVEVEKLSLQLAGRIECEPVDNEEDIVGRPVMPFYEFGALILPNESAPKSGVDEDFRNVCLEGKAMDDVIKNNPELAREILLSVLLRANGSKESSTDRTYGLKNIQRWFPPFYNRGPFLSFLKLSEVEGVKLIIELCNIVAENWKCQLEPEVGTAVTKLFFDDGAEREYFGDDRIYFWFRDSGHATHSLVAALMALERHLMLKIDRDEDITEAVERILTDSISVAPLGILSSIGKYKQDLFLDSLKPLLGEINILHWEMRLSYGANNVEGHQMIGSELLGLNTVKYAYEWNKMKHRRQSIKDVAILLFFKIQSIRTYFEEQVIPKWIQKREELDGSGQIDPFLDNMIGQFNVENYEQVQHDGYYTLEYREPEKITIKLDEIRKDKRSNSDMDGFAFRISQEIENNKIYNLQEIDAIWKAVQKSDGSNIDANINFLNDPVANAFAAVAVIILNWDLLKDSRPNYTDWAIKMLSNATSTGNLSYRGTDSNPLDQSAESFQALSIPILYSLQPDNPTVKDIIGNFVIKSSYPVIEKTFKSLGNVFNWDDPLFISLQNLYVERCHLTHKVVFSVWEIPEVDFDLILEPALVNFIEKGTDDKLTDWSVYRKLSEPTEDQPKKSKHGNYYSSYNDPGIDIQGLYYAFSHIPQLSETVATASDRTVIMYYQKIVELLTYMWGKTNGERLPFDDYPGKFDKWVSSRFAKMLATKIPIDEARAIWQPLMRYGYINQKWLEDFTREVLYANFQNADANMLGMHWNALIDFAIGDENWNYNNRSFQKSRLWESLLGISSVGLSIWRAGHEEIISTISGQLKKWFRKHVNDPEQIKNLCSLLKSPSCGLFIRDGVQLVKLHLEYQGKLDGVKPPAKMVRVPFAYDDEVASMCASLWESKRDEIVRQEDVFQGFKEIVVYLAAKQIVTGIELQERLLSL